MIKFTGKSWDKLPLYWDCEIWNESMRTHDINYLDLVSLRKNVWSEVANRKLKCSLEVFVSQMYVFFAKWVTKIRFLC